MNLTEFELTFLGFMWDNPWSILVALAIVVGVALWARRVFSPDCSYVRGLPRCNMCLDGTKSRHKVVYNSKEIAVAAAERYQRQFGRQWPYRAECGYWHLTSQSPGISRQSSVRR